MTTIYLPCEALINQGSFIGGDPIGHACYNNATHHYSQMVGDDLWPRRVCQSCYMRLVDGDEAVSFPRGPSMTDEQIAEFLDKHRKAIQDAVATATENTGKPPEFVRVVG